MAEPVISMGDWEKLHGHSTFGHKTASLVQVAAEQSRYLLSHCTIMSSVMCEEDQDWKIKPTCSHLVNNNDDAWSNPVLELSHKTFVGAFNFVEHYQNSKHAKGHILDAILRKIQISGPDVWVYFCDILVATDLEQDELVSEIRSGDVRYLSMGCVTDLVICSYCGQRVLDNGDYCTHLMFQKGTFIEDEEGTMRRVAEMCGHESLPNGGVRFVEASWVATPAFPGAALRNIVSDSWVGPKTPFTHAFSDRAASYKMASEHEKHPSQERGRMLADLFKLRN
jgi:hypothetical protein